MKSKFINEEMAEKLASAIAIAKVHASNLADAESNAGTPFEIHKSLNVLFKELRAQEIFVRSLLEGENKKYLRELDVEVLKPQSWRFYTGEKLD